MTQSAYSKGDAKEEGEGGVSGEEGGEGTGDEVCVGVGDDIKEKEEAKGKGGDGVFNKGTEKNGRENKRS